MSKFADRVYEQSTTTGTSDAVLSGAIVGYQAFVAAFGAAAPFYYVLAHPTLAEWEVGLSNGVTLISGRYVLARTTILKSSNANAKVDFSQGRKEARCALPAEVAEAILLDPEVLAIAGLFSAANKGIHFTGTGTAAVHDLTTVARTLLAQPTQTLMRTTGLGCGTVATLDSDTDGTLAANSDTMIATQKATKTYADAASAAAAAAAVSDTAYNATSWNGVLNIAPSKNAVRDKFASLSAGDLTNGTISGDAGTSIVLATSITGTGSQVCSISPGLTTPAIGSGGANFAGATSGTANLQAPAIAGSAIVTLPGVTGTLATLAGAEALTNKTINGNTITSGTGVLTLGAGKTLTASNTLMLTGTDGSSVAFGAGGTAAFKGVDNAFSAVQTISLVGGAATHLQLTDTSSACYWNTNNTVNPSGFRGGVTSSPGAQFFLLDNGNVTFGCNSINQFVMTPTGIIIGGNASIGSGATCNLVLGGTSASPSTSPVLGAATADIVSLAALDTAAADRNVYARNEEGHVDRLTGLGCRCGTQFDKTSNTTLGNVTGLTRNVSAGEIVGFEAVLYTTSNVAGGVKAAIGGTATATSVIYEATVKDGSTAATMGTARATALGTTVGDVTAVTAAQIVIRGTIVVNAAGTLTVQFAQNASNGTASSVLVNSSFRLFAIGA